MTTLDLFADCLIGQRESLERQLSFCGALRCRMSMRCSLRLPLSKRKHRFATW